MTIERMMLLFMLLWAPAGSAGAGGGDLFVAPSGRDENPGTREAPLATLGGARDAVRRLKETEGLPPGGVTVWLAGGRYVLERPFVLDARDGGTGDAPLTYRAEEGAVVRITGGRVVRGFGPVKDPAARARLPEEARGKVFQAKLSDSGITDLGDPAAPGRRLELFFRDRPMTLARWPNEGFTRVGDLLGSKPMKAHGIPGNREGIFTYTGDRPDRWKDEAEIYLHGYWFWDWSDAYQKVASIDRAKKVITLAPPFHRYGFRKGQRYYALNLLSELDRPGEWYADRARGILYFWPPAPLREGDVVVSVAPALVEVKDAGWITFQGLLFEACRGTAVILSGCTRVRVAGCIVRNTGAWGVRIQGGRENAVSGCDLLDLGEGGIALSGGDRRTLTPAGNRAENDHIHHFSRLFRTYRPAVSVSGVGQKVLHNLIHDAPHNAIQLSGNDHLVAFNEIHHVCCETGDVGAFYMGRDWTARGTKIRHNFFHHIHGPGLYGAMAVYLDDAASGITVEGNVFYKAGRAVFIGGGRDNVVENNLFVECEASVHVDARGLGWMRYHVVEGGTLPKRLAAVPYRKPPWSTRYPRLVNILADEPGAPKGNVVRRNVSYKGRWLDVEKKARPYVRFEDNLVTGANPGIVDLEKLDFRLRPGSQAFAIGFQPIPVEEIGLIEEGDRQSLPPVDR